MSTLSNHESFTENTSADRPNSILDRLLEMCDSREGEDSDSKSCSARLEELEQRVLYDASPLGALTEQVQLVEEVNSDNGLGLIEFDIGQSTSFVPLIQANDSNEIANALNRLIVVDERVENYEALISSVAAEDSGYEVLILDSQSDGLSRVTNYLESSLSTFGSVHFISHANETGFELGSSDISVFNFGQYETEFRQWNLQLADGADILLYGCNLAGSPLSQSMLESISEWTSADIAASDDLTGHQDLGGDWDLEFVVGEVESSALWSHDSTTAWLGLLDITTGLQGHWTFDSASGAQDSSGNGYDGTFVGDAFVDTNSGTNQVGDGKLSLDGFGDYADLSAHTSSFSGLTQGTVSAWVKSTTNLWGSVFELSDFSAFDDHAIFAIYNGELEWQVKDGPMSSVFATTVGAGLNDGMWHHVAATIDASGNKLYVDGVQQTGSDISYLAGSSASNDFFDDVNFLDAMTIGVDLYNSGSLASEYDGLIDDVRVYNRALSSADVLELQSIGSYTPSDLELSQVVQGGLSLNNDGGNDAYLKADDGGSLLGGLSSLTFELEFSTTDSGTDNPLISYATSSYHNAFHLDIRSNGDLQISINDTASSTLSTAYDYRAIEDGESHRLSFTWNNTAGNWQVFVDGELVDSGTGLKIGETIGSGGVLLFGQEQDSVEGGFGSSDVFSGTIYDIRLFDDVRTGTELLNGLQNPLPFDEPNLVAHWTFDELSNDGVLTDRVSGNNLTVKHYSGGGFTTSVPTLLMAVDENSATNTVVGKIYGTDQERETQIATLLASDSDLVYNAETGKFYKAYASAVNWVTAKSTAESTGLNGVNGQLATIRSASENVAVTSVASTVGGSVWLGATDGNVEGEWHWIESGVEADQFWSGAVSGSNYEGAYENWESWSEPNDATGGEDAARLDTITGRWLDAPTTGYNHNYIVEWDADDVLDVSDALTYAITSQTVAGAFAIDSDTGEITVANGALLDYESNTSHNLTVQITDGDSSTYSESFAVEINDIGVELTQSVPGTQAIAEEAVLVFSSANGNAVTVANGGPADDLLQVVLSVSNGTLTLSQTTGLSIPDGANGSSTMTIHGTESNINLALAGMFYTPTGDYVGSDTLQIATSVDADLVGLYQFESGNASDDSAGPSQDGTLQGDAFVTTNATQGQVLDMNGSGKVRIAGTFGDPADVTLAAWVNLSSADIAGAEVISIGNDFGLRLDSIAGLHSFGRDGGGYTTLSHNVTLANAGWHHVAVTFDDSTLQQTLYLDGVAVATGVASGSITYSGTSPDTYIGSHGDPSNGTFDFDGQIDDARIYDRALTADEINAIANSTHFVSDSVAINISGVNDDPINAGTFPTDISVAVNLLSSVDFSGIDLFDVDIGLSDMTVTLLTSTGGNLTAASGGGVSVSGSGTGALTIWGTVADLNAYLDSTGNITYLHSTPNLSGMNVDTIQVDITDNGGSGSGGGGAVNLGITNVDIIAGNAAPVITSNGGGATATTNVAENLTSVTFVTSTDTDGGTPSYSVSGGLDAMLFNVNSVTGELVFVNAPDYETPLDTDFDNVYEVTVQVSDGNGGTDIQAISVTVTPVNEAPVITSDGGGAVATTNTAENTTAVTTVTSSDVDGSTPVYSIIGGDDAGTFSITSSTGVLIFVAAPDYEIPTDFDTDNIYEVNVQVSDGNGGTDVQSISVTVTPVNEAPVITSNGGGVSAVSNTAENTTAVTTVTSTDVDGNTPIYSIIGGVDSSRFSIGSATGVLAFVAAPDFETPMDADFDNVYDVIVQVSDGLGGTDSQTISVTVTPINEAPVITSNGGGAVATTNTDENTTAVTTVTSSDVDGSTPVYSIIGGADAGAFSITSSTGVLTFVAAPDYEVPTDFDLDNIYEVNVQVSDGAGGVDTQSISVNVMPVNEQPAVAIGPGIAANEGGTQAITTANIGIVDPEDSDSDLTLSITTLPTNGQLELVGNPGVAISSFTKLDLVNGYVCYVHDGSETSSDSFVFDVSDVGGLVSTGHVLPIIINPVNDIPVGTNDIVAATEDQALSASSVLANDTDAEMNSLTASLVTGPSNASSFNLNSDGTFSYLPVSNFNGVDSFSYRVSDGNGGMTTASVTINVAAVNDAPVGANDTRDVIAGDVLISSSVLANDSDVEGVSLIANVVSPPQHGFISFLSDGTFLYTPFSNFVGTDTFVYVANDGFLNSAPVTVSIQVSASPVNGGDGDGGFEPAPEPDNTPTENEQDEAEDNEEELLGLASSLNGEIHDVGFSSFDEKGSDATQLEIGIASASRAQAHSAAPIVQEALTLLVSHGASTRVHDATLAQEFSNVALQEVAYDVRQLLESINPEIRPKDTFSVIVTNLNVSLGAVSAVSTAGYILWSLRGGILYATTLSSLPTWRMIDPLPVLDAYAQSTSGGELDESDRFFS